ncbi:MAG TPA: phosphoadenosine phosphosulfate reductase family protein [Nitratidesulfovibrio sp.]|nr:phosphoadenosine phosphosulfate reductase family protein [Nitratidesulfovibrio sp.]
MLLDAAGNVPAPLTAHEQSWAQAVDSGAVQAANDELTRRQALPLSEKIDMTLSRIRDWYKAWDGMVSVSYSGGKDSTLLLHLVRMLYPDVPAVFANTGLEYPEVVKAVKRTPNHVVLRPKMSFREVISRYGWPIASKKIARGVSILRHPTERNQNIRRLYDIGINRYGKEVAGYKVPAQWRFLVDAPFEVSDMCCAVMKKGPAASYEKATGRMPFVGTLAADSKARQRDYLKFGCNAYDMTHPKSRPLSFWTEQDVLAALVEMRIPIPAVYGRIARGDDGLLRTTGVRRTGCTFCCFGLHMDHLDGTHNRFEQMAVTHPRLYAYCMDRLGLRRVLRYCRDAAPGKLASRFRWEVPMQRMGQGNMLEDA